MFSNTGRFEESVNSLANNGMIKTVFFHLEWSLSCLLRCFRSCLIIWKVVIWVRFWEKSEMTVPPVFFNKEPTFRAGGSPLKLHFGVLEYWSDGVMRILRDPIYEQIFVYRSETQSLMFCSSLKTYTPVLRFIHYVIDHSP